MSEKDKEQAARNDNRLKAMLMGQSDAVKFVAIALASVLQPKQVGAVLDQIRGAEGVNFDRKIEEVGNRPLRHFLNKSDKQLRDELGGDETKIDAVRNALRDAGLSDPVEPQSAGEGVAIVGHSLVESSPEDIAKFKQIADRNSANLPFVKHEGETFGRDQYPASELWDFSDDELAAVEGITAANIVRLRQLRDENAAAVASPVKA